MACNNLLAYTYFNKLFDIQKDAIYFQIRAVISQERKQITYFSRKPTGTQNRYTEKEKELLIIVETIK